MTTRPRVFLVVVALLVSAAANAGTYTVTNTNDTGAGSFRQGVLDANSNTCADPCTITFDATLFATTQTINLAFPGITVTANNVFVDGFSGGAVGTMNTNAFGSADNSVQRVVINGASNTCCPITVSGNNFQIRGVVLQDFLTALIIQGTGAVITGSKIGTNATGTAAGSPANVTGIEVANTGSATIGGTTPAARNLISGQLGNAINLQSGGNLVIGNYIGTDAAGTGAVPNGKGINSVANGNTIGNVSIGNVISGNTSGRGIEVSGGTGTTISSNRIGTTIDGTAALANTVGIYIGGGLAPGSVTVGGTGLANLISGNTTNGIEINSSAGSNNLSFNVIGLNGALSATIPNGATGIVLTGAGTTNSITNNFIGGNGDYGILINGAADTTIQNNFIGYVSGTPRPNLDGGVRITAVTGTTLIVGNAIRNNGGTGVGVDGAIIGVSIKQNQIADNTGLGIDLHNASGSLGATPNDVGDTDTGAGNHLQNFPAVTAAYVNGTTVTSTFTVKFNVDSSGVGTTAGIRVEAFKADTDPTNPEGFQFLQGQCYAGNNILNQTMTVPTAGLVPGDKVVLTATSYTNAACTTVNEGTSEFSPGTTVSLQPGIVVDTSDVGAGSLRQAITDANSGACASPCAITFNIPMTDPNFAGGVYTIRPLTALPDIMASNTTLDGATQTAFTGDTNGTGPEIVINGSLITGAAAGLQVSSNVTGQGSNITIRNVVVNGFPNEGIFLDGSSLPLNNIQVLQNYIGTDPTGASAVPNASTGVYVGDSVTGALIGSTGLGNLISGNTANGVTFSNVTAANSVRGNKIGIDRTGSFAIPNGGAGVLISASANIVVGGTVGGEGNTIAHNGGAGVAVSGGAGSALNSIRGNSIHSNTFLGIDLAGDLVTANDAGDVDSGENGWQNFPVLTLASYNAGTNQTTFTGTLNSLPNTTFDIDWYSNFTLDGSTHGEGQTYLNTSTFTTDGTGNTPVSIVLSGNQRTANVVATASRVSGPSRETSEFSTVAANNPPTATNDATSTNEDTAVTFDPRANDTDPENGALQITGNTQPSPSEGSVSCTTTSCTFTPAANYNGPASFNYTITDDGGNQSSATVSITVNAINDPPVANPDPLATSEDTPNSVNVLTNDTDVDGPSPLTVSGNTSGANGTASCSPSGGCTYTPNANFSGTDSFTYTVSDGATTSTGTVNVTVNAVNDPPVASPDAINTNEDTPGAVNVLANDSDIDGPSTLTVTGNTSGANGTASCTALGNCTYTPNPNFAGTDSFTYTVSDGPGTTTGTVNVTVNAINDPPAAVADAIGTTEDSPGAVNVLANDTDVDGPSSLTVTGNTSGANGTAVCAAGGNCTYTPNPNFAGTDSFTYTVSDGATTSVGTVNITVSPVNDPPVANPDTLVTNQNTPNTVNVLTNDTDVDGPTLSVTASTNGTKGTVSCTAIGNCTYTPNLNQTGADSFTYTASDGTSNATGTVSVTINATNAPPNANPDFAETTQGNPVSFNVLANDSDPNGDPISVITNTTPTNGSVICNPGGACTYTPGAGFTGVATFNYTIQDTAGGTSSATVTINVKPCPDPPTAFTPANNATGVATTGKLFWNSTGGQSYSIYLGRADRNGCSQPFGSTDQTFLDYSNLEGNTTYSWRVEVVTSGCPTVISACNTFTTRANCNVTVNLVKPLGGTATSPVEFEWLAVNGATEYTVFAKFGGGNFLELGKTATTKLIAAIPADGPVEWFVVASVTGCGNVQSSTATFNLCNRPAAPLARVVGETTSAKTYSVEWDEVPNAIRYEIDEATNPSFTGATTQSTDKLSVAFKHDATDTPLAFYYRVRAFSACTPLASDHSPAVRIIIIPLPRPNEENPNVNVPAGSQELVVQQVFIEGVPGVSATFSAVTDRPWLTVRPASGILPPEGITLEVVADPRTLPNGTFTATVIVTITTPTVSGISGHGTTTASKPISISLVTPVTPVQNKIAPSGDALIIPSVGHLDGVNSHWQSDIRVTNTGLQAAKYNLTFTPSAGTATGIKATTINVGPGETTALDDIIKNWFGIGSLGDSANGMLEIRAADAVPFSAVASSRTYNVTDNGTLGQFIPALPFSGFIGRALTGSAPPASLSMQQIAQSSAFRTNVGIVEASGKPANGLMSVFNTAGVKLADIPFSLAGGEQRQLNSVLAANNITLNDGRIQVQVTGGDGKVTAYASVVDNATNDPLLVSGVQTNVTGASKYVLPGVADLTNALANWRTDMRVFNASLASQNASLTLHPLGGGAPLNASLTLQPGEVRTLDDVVKTVFGASNIGGAVHVQTATNTNLVVTGRTYNQTSEGTFGQFIEAVTPDKAVGANGRSLHVLQVEDSTRYRTNLGIAEVTGQPVTVEVQIFLPDSKVTPTITFPMAANEFRQLSVIRDQNLGNVYNARLAVRVVSGTGRVTAYGSVIDMTTQDPTYVPGQ
jgi:Bacterial Ig domain/Right handed beta helix region